MIEYKSGDSVYVRGTYEGKTYDYGLCPIIIVHSHGSGYIVDTEADGAVSVDKSWLFPCDKNEEPETPA